MPYTTENNKMNNVNNKIKNPLELRLAYKVQSPAGCAGPPEAGLAELWLVNKKNILLGAKSSR